MAPRNTIVASLLNTELESRERLGKLKVMVADRDYRTASLVQRILFSFGFRSMDVITSGESALALLRERHYDIIITEWNMAPVDGLELVKAIRAAKEDQRIRRDTPVIMLTGRADMDSVQIARDVGITEFVAKPFSAKTISHRIIQIIDNPRLFVESRSYVGPDRRRRGEPPPGVADRRGRSDATIRPADNSLREQLGNLAAAELLNDRVVEQAQVELLKSAEEFIDWAREDIEKLEGAYRQLQRDPEDRDATRVLGETTYAIQSLAGTFGYPLGTEVAGLLVEYLRRHPRLNADQLVVVRKHLDTIGVIFKEKIKESGQEIAREMVMALRQLSQKLG